MSKQIGVIKLKGNLGGISFYQSDGLDLARIANGPSKDRIENDPAFQRTRENNREFGGSARAAKSLRLSLVGAVQTMGDSRLVSRLTKLFKEINASGPGTRGERAIQLSQHHNLLMNFEFNKVDHFASKFNAPFTASANAARDEGTIDIPNFLPQNYISAPSGATHFRLVHAVGAVSDYAFDPSSERYEPLEPSADAIGAQSATVITPLNATAPVTFNIVTALPGPPVMTADTSGIQALGIEFYQEVNGQFYLLAQGNCMKVVQVF